jgi:hypothetical protein
MEKKNYLKIGGLWVMILRLHTSWKNLLPPSSVKSLWCWLCRFYVFLQLCFASVHGGGSVPIVSNNVLLAALNKMAVLATGPSSWKVNYSYYHSFGMSENYLVFIEQPLIVNSMKLITSQIKGKCMHDCMTWSPEEQVVYRCSQGT